MAAQTTGLVLLAALVAGAQFSAASTPSATNLNVEGGPRNGKRNGLDKVAAMEKVLQMLEDMVKHVMGEGEKEAKAYNKFSCWCKDMLSEKGEAIRKGTDEQSALSADINNLATKRDGLDKAIAGLLNIMKKTKEAMDKAVNIRHKEQQTYEANAADLQGAVDALKGAKEVMLAGNKPSASFLQSVGETVKTAALLADALGIEDTAVQRTAALFLQAPNNDVEMENYKSHSGGIQEALEKLLTDFRQQKVDVDAEEVKAVAAHDAFMQEKTAFMLRKETELKDTQKAKSVTIEEIGAASEQLSTVSATILDDQAFLMEAGEMCSNRAKTWDMRSHSRSLELQALTNCINVVGNQENKAKVAGTNVRLAQTSVNIAVADSVAEDNDSMESIEEAAEEAEQPAVPSFIQRSERKLRGKQIEQHNPATAQEALVTLLRSKGQKFKSTMLTSLANKVGAMSFASELSGADPLAKVKTLIDELIQRLLQEEANEASQKGWCDKATAEAEQKRDHASQEVELLNGEMAREEARRDGLTRDLNKLTDEIATHKKDLAQANKDRKEDHEANVETIKDADEGREVVDSALDILVKFYKTAAKQTIKDEGKIKFDQEWKGPTASEEAPDSGFETGQVLGSETEAAATGVIGMMEVVRDDFLLTVKQTEQAEQEASDDHLKFSTETESSIAQKIMALKITKSQLSDSNDKLAQADEDMSNQIILLQTSLTELMELKPTCIDTGMSYEERVARREEEIESLKQALCIFQNFGEYGAESSKLIKSCS